jgi:hypothetical protein
MSLLCLPVSPKDAALEIKDPIDPSALEQARTILQEIRSAGEVEKEKLVAVAQRLGDIPNDSSVLVKAKEDGAQAIATMAYGLEAIAPSCDVIVGPGNKCGHCRKVACQWTLRH